MKILLDHNVPKRFRLHLPGHTVETARERGWEKLANGVLLRTAAAAGIEVFLSVDKKLQHEQNLRTLPLAVVVIDSLSNALPALIPFAAPILKLLETPLDPALYVVESSGMTSRF